MSLRRLQRNWDAFAREDPLWAILTWEERRDGRWDPEAFFATGRDEVATVLASVRAWGPLATGRALDFGCGVGRLSRALADEFGEVHGVDIAPRMIEVAREFDPRVRYAVNTTPNLSRYPDAHFDFLYSSITLQHMPPALMEGYVREFVRVLRPGGVLAVQIPDRLRQRPRTRVGVLASRCLRWFRGLASRRPVMDMYGVPRARVEEWLAGCSVVHAEPSSMAGEAWLAWLYFARK